MEFDIKNAIPFTIAPKNEIHRCKSNKICSGSICRKLFIMKEFKEFH